MCLLIVKPAGVSIPSPELLAAARANPHGAGIAWSDGSTVRIAKDATWGGTDVVDALAPLHGSPALIHFRYATHGGRNDANAHPFWLPHGYAAAHNGIIHGVECQPDESDTRAFLRQYVAPTLQLWGRLPQTSLANIQDLHGPGNKLAFLSPAGEYHITNEKAGYWENGAWYSNGNHKYAIWGDDDGLPDVADIRDTNAMRCDYCGNMLSGEFLVLDDCSFSCPECRDYTFPKNEGRRYL